MKTFLIALAIAFFATCSFAINEPPKVYFTRDISPLGLDKVYKALDRKATGKGKVAVKVHSGEPGNPHYLSNDLIRKFVLDVNGTIVECNTAYGGGRANTDDHVKVMREHGFDFAPFDIMDDNGSVKLPVNNGKHLKYDLVGINFLKYDFVVILSHFKGHAMGGFGGAVKNMSIGIASADGKVLIHSAGKYEKVGTQGAFNTDQDAFLESMAEAAKAVADYKGRNILYINVMNNLSVDCDCDGNPHAPEMKDIGILASLDPVALDKACVDLVYKAPNNKALVERIESRHGTHTLDYGASIGLGSLEYKLIELK